MYFNCTILADIALKPSKWTVMNACRFAAAAPRRVLSSNEIRQKEMRKPIWKAFSSWQVTSHTAPTCSSMGKTVFKVGWRYLWCKHFRLCSIYLKWNSHLFIILVKHVTKHVWWSYHHSLEVKRQVILIVCKIQIISKLLHWSLFLPSYR